MQTSPKLARNSLKTGPKVARKMSETHPKLVWNMSETHRKLKVLGACFQACFININQIWLALTEIYLFTFKEYKNIMPPVVAIRDLMTNAGNILLALLIIFNSSSMVFRHSANGWDNKINIIKWKQWYSPGFMWLKCFDTILLAVCSMAVAMHKINTKNEEFQKDFFFLSTANEVIVFLIHKVLTFILMENDFLTTLIVW